MRLTYVFITALAVTLAAPDAAHAACTCGIVSSPDKPYVPPPWTDRDRVFIGTVLDADTMAGTMRKSVQFVTEASWRGAMPDTVTLLISDDAGCVYYFAGYRYFVVADLLSPDATTLVTSKCDGSWSAEHPAAMKVIDSLGYPVWHAPPMGSRALDSVAIRIGERPPRGSSDEDLVFGISINNPDTIARFQIADQEFPRDRTSLFHLPPGLYQFRVTWKDGSTDASYVSLRCGRRPNGDRCLVHRAIHKPKRAVCPRPTGAPYLPCQVESVPAPLPGRAVPRFPDTFLKEQTSGSVRVRYVVDTTGRPDMSTFAVVDATHKLFEVSVRNVLPSARFTPGTLGGRKVPVRMEEAVVFNAPPGQGLFALRAAHDTLADGVPRTIISGPPRDTAAASAMSPDELARVQWSVIERMMTSDNELSSQRSSSSNFTVCVKLFRDGTPPSTHAERLRQASSLTRKVVDIKNCPPTYASPQMRVDSLGRRIDPTPPGWVDPHQIIVRSVKPWSGDAVSVEADVRQGTGGRRYQCGAERVGDVWQVTCRNVVSFVS